MFMSIRLLQPIPQLELLEYCKAYFEILSSYFNFRNVKKGNSVQDCKNCAMHKRNGFIRASLIYFLFLFLEYCTVVHTTKKFVIILLKLLNQKIIRFNKYFKL